MVGSAFHHPAAPGYRGGCDPLAKSHWHGQPFENLLQHVSPLDREHINLTRELCLAAKQARSESRLQGATAPFGILNALYIPNSVVSPVIPLFSRREGVPRGAAPRMGSFSGQLIGGAGQ